MIVVAEVAFVLYACRSEYTIVHFVAFYILSRWAAWLFLRLLPLLGFDVLAFLPPGPPGDAAMATFRERFEQGLELVQAGRDEEAASVFAEAARIRPDDLALALVQAPCLARRGQRSEAIEVLERAERFHPDEPRVHYALASTLTQFNQNPRALAALANAIELDPTLREFLSEDPEFDALHDEDDFIRLVGAGIRP
jgi:Flp pilus assembly protein TadD